MLARIAHELYWIGRQLSRAEHTARMLDGVFHADVQGRRDDPGVRLSWDALPDRAAIDELVGATRAATPAATLQAVAELIPERFEYRTGVTYVGSTVEDLLDAGAGMCQDFAHLALVLLRRHGLPRATCRATCSRRTATRPTPPRSTRTPGSRR
jgi:transglutaminase-like putative cysteine protease